MADVRIEHTYNCSEDTFWDKLFLDDEYNRRMFKEALSFPVHEQTKFEDKGDLIERTLEIVPKLGEMPGPLKKLLGDNLGYREDGVYDKKARTYSVNITPNKLSDKVTIKGKMSTKPAGDGKCLRVFECSVTAKVFGVGGMLEKRVISDMETSYATAAKFTNDYIAEKGL